MNDRLAQIREELSALLGDAAAAAAPVQVTLVVTDERPVYIRLPRRATSTEPGEVCRWTGLARRRMAEIATEIGAVVDDPPGSKVPVRLVHLPTLLAWLDGQRRRQNGGAVCERAAKEEAA